jgi:hypothetical protein
LKDFRNPLVVVVVREPNSEREFMTTLEPKMDMRPTRALPMMAFQDFITPTPRTLEQAICAVVCAVEDGSIKRLSPNDPRPFDQSRAALALITRCYAQQIYSSAQITGIAKCDPDFPRLWGEEHPDAQSFRQFRAENRETIHRCLVMVLRFIGEQKISLGVLTKVSDAQLAEEASRRIIMATFIDSMELDAAHVADPPAEISYLFANNRARVH